MFYVRTALLLFCFLGFFVIFSNFFLLLLLVMTRHIQYSDCGGIASKYNLGFLLDVAPVL